MNVLVPIRSPLTLGNLSRFVKREKKLRRKYMHGLGAMNAQKELRRSDANSQRASEEGRDWVRFWQLGQVLAAP